MATLLVLFIIVVVAVLIIQAIAIDNLTRRVDSLVRSTEAEKAVRAQLRVELRQRLHKIRRRQNALESSVRARLNN